MTVGSATPIEIPTAGRYRIDPRRSTLAYTGRHLFGLGTVHATFQVLSGEVVVADPVTGTTVAAVVDAGSFSSGNARRDRDVTGAGLLDSDAHPEIRFTCTGTRQDGDRWLLAGTVTAHGVSVPVELAIDRCAREGTGMRVHARAEHLDRHAFGVTGGRGMVGRHLDLDLDVVADPA
ncbi:YceI family protein [Geodermatophilus aquaeductus]|jgi:polyisoprenoid-binding protein YceI|uniref:Polyisoprenoid-binding protein YceI n=1 Tax=Geodermatophilus aquaeductus TaxID=1564161 RepID=A0A521FKA0_9ACTN|nr:YceI family protein [Geodermatophilus aquaeductus]SMO96556.1 Polyisoprenoid-binding protein YceI [Geodermatophilus aquaeductus]